MIPPIRTALLMGQSQLVLQLELIQVVPPKPIIKQITYTNKLVW